MSTQDLINQLREAIPRSIAEEIVGVQPMGRAAPDTWQSYLRRLGNGINGISERSKTLTEKDIIVNAEHYMQKKYPGNYVVESYYNANKMKYDLRLRFEDPKEELMWMMKNS